MLIVTALFLPAGQVAPFLVMALRDRPRPGRHPGAGQVLLLAADPRGKEAEYFSFYHAMDRGTSWFGTLVFGLVYQFTDSYRPAIFALIAFFLIGGLLLMKVDTRKGIQQAGNDVPRVV